MDRTGLMHMGRGERKSKHCERDAGAMTLQIGASGNSGTDFERKASRNLDGQITQIGCGVHHGYWMRRGARSARLGGDRTAC